MTGIKNAAVNNEQEGIVRKEERLQVARPLATCRKHLAYDGTESRDDYLFRAGKRLDKIENHPEKAKADPELSDLTEEDVRDYRAYLCDFVAGDVQKEARKMALRVGMGNLEHYEMLVFSYLLESVINNLHRYNNTAYLKVKTKYSFLSFVRMLEPDVFQQIISEERDVGKYLAARMNIVKKTKEQIFSETGTDMDLISAEQVHERLGGKDGSRLSLEQIKAAMDRLKGNLPLEGIDERKLKEKGNPFEDAEKEGYKESIRELFSSLRRLQVYVLLKKNTINRTRDVFDELAADKTVRALFLEDPHYKERVNKDTDGNADGPDGKLGRDVYCAALKKVKAFVKKNGIEAEDLEGVLGDLMQEMLGAF